GCTGVDVRRERVQFQVRKSGIYPSIKARCVADELQRCRLVLEYRDIELQGLGRELKRREPGAYLNRRGYLSRMPAKRQARMPGRNLLRETNRGLMPGQLKRRMTSVEQVGDERGLSSE